MSHTNGRVAVSEQYSGWLSLTFALTMAIGNPNAILYRIAEHSTSRALWVVGFGILGVALLSATWWNYRRGRFLLASFAAIHWAFFGTQAWVVGANGAAAIAVVVVSYMIINAHKLHHTGWDD